MNCIEVMRSLADFLRGRLAQPEAHSLLLHTAGCADCDLVLGSARNTLQTYFNMIEKRQQNDHALEESHAA
jgi:hypothetical protein